MVVDPDVVRAIAETLSRAEIETFRAAAVAEVLKGPHVKMTSSSFQDQSSAGVFVDRPAAEVVRYCNEALDYLQRQEDGDQVRPNPQMNHMDMRGQYSGW